MSWKCPNWFRAVCFYEEDYYTNQGSFNFLIGPWSKEWECWDVAWQVYKEFMDRFKTEMNAYFGKSEEGGTSKKGMITKIEVGLGPSGELRYPGYRSDWNIGPPAGIGAFQVSGILLCKSSATCNQCNLFERNHMEQDSYAQEDLCSVLIVGMHLLSMRVQLDHKSVAAVTTLSLLLVFCTRFMGRLQMVVSHGTLLSAASGSMSWKFCIQNPLEGCPTTWFCTKISVTVNENRLHHCACEHVMWRIPFLYAVN